MDTITVRYGKHTFTNTTAKVNVFAVVYNSNKVIGLNKRLEDSTSGAYSPAILAARDGYADAGSWYSKEYVGKSNLILRVDVSVAHHGSPYADASVFILLEPLAPLVRITCNLVWAPDNAVYSTLASFLGNAYVLDLGDLEQHGVIPDDRFIRNRMQQSEIEELLNIETLTYGVIPTLPDVRLVDDGKGGTRTIVVPVKRKRRVRIIRGKV